jgi:hypothetical protein
VIRPTVARVDLDAIHSNFGVISDFLRSGSQPAPGINGVV